MVYIVTQLHEGATLLTAVNSVVGSVVGGGVGGVATLLTFVNSVVGGGVTLLTFVNSVVGGVDKLNSGKKMCESMANVKLKRPSQRPVSRAWLGELKGQA
jgi:hypothetical protein